MHLPVGTFLHGETYRIIRFIKSGGFGCTYEARHVLLDSRVAIKEFFPKDFCVRDGESHGVSLLAQSNARLVGKLKGKFIEEAKALFRIEHPGIVRVTDVFEENGTAYYVMDYIEGESLGEMVRRRGSIPEGEAVGYILQVADALGYVHSQNRLHLDVKPANIMVGKDGNAVLIDFGASKHYDEGSGENTSTLMGVHTKGYAPMEQMNTNFTTFSPATDIYSLGATLYKLVTGVTPPDAISLANEDATLRPLPAGSGGGVWKAIQASMRARRKDRPQGIGEFVSILGGGYGDGPTVIDTEAPAKTESAPAGEAGPREGPVQGPGPGGDGGGKPFFRRKPFIIGVALAVLVVVGALVCFDGLRTSPASGTINGHEWVDLGLSVKWATCNVGASSPSDYGDYYAWGETSTKSSYDTDNSVTYGKNMGSIAGDSRYDAARANWGGTWRLPTKEEIDELVSKCKSEWTTVGGHKGWNVTGPNGNSIFLPAAGFREGTSLSYADELGRYWGATPLTDIAYNLYFNSDEFYGYWGSWYYGRSVRPVLASPAAGNGGL